MKGIGTTASPFIRKLRHGARLTDDDEAILGALSSLTYRADRGDIMVEGTKPRSLAIVLEGWVCRYRLLENGKRQITSVLLPGDLCEPFGALPPFMTDTLSALTPALIAYAEPHTIRGAAHTSLGIEQALWWDLLVSDASKREHAVSLGRRTATERLGHFFCEVHIRLGMVGLADQSTYDLPLTQADLADLFGLSAVQVNRSIQELRGSTLLSLRGRRMTIHDVRGLRDLSMFDPSYLLLYAWTMRERSARNETWPT